MEQQSPGSTPTPVSYLKAHTSYKTFNVYEFNKLLRCDSKSVAKDKFKEIDEEMLTFKSLNKEVRDFLNILKNDGYDVSIGLGNYTQYYTRKTERDNENMLREAGNSQVTVYANALHGSLRMALNEHSTDLHYDNPRRAGTYISNPDPIDELFGNISQDTLSSEEDSDNNELAINSPPHVVNDYRNVDFGNKPRPFMFNGFDIAGDFYDLKQYIRDDADLILLPRIHVQEICTLSHILLLKPNQNSPIVLKFFKKETLSLLHRHQVNDAINAETKFPRNVRDEVETIIMNVKGGAIDRDLVALRLDTLIVANNDEYNKKVMRMIKNIIATWPVTPFPDIKDIGENDLINTYIDPIMKPLLANPDEYMHIKWSNTQDKGARFSGLNSSKQGDGYIVLYSPPPSTIIGNVEVKPVYREKENNCLAEDLVRISCMDKDCIDVLRLKYALGVQVVGLHVTFYVCSLIAQGLYTITQFYEMNIPPSFVNTESIIMMMTPLKQVAEFFWEKCQEKVTNAFIDNNKRDTLNTPNMKSLLNESKGTKRKYQDIFTY